MPRSLTQCNCSVCRRFGALWAYYTHKSVEVRSDQGPRKPLKSYSWRPGGLEFFHCQRCGVLTHYEAAEKGPDDRIAINGRIMDPLAVAHLPIKLLDGDSTWKVLSESAQPNLFLSPKRQR